MRRRPDRGRNARNASGISLLRYETSAAAYDTQNLRVRVKDASGDRRILLDGIEELAEYDTTTGERIKRYDHDPSQVDSLLAQKGSGGQKLNAYSDALGSVYGLVDAQGNAQAKYSYDVYGARTASLENVGTDWGFTGRRFDGATGLGYYRARYYGAEVGAFTSVDPAGHSPFSPEVRRYLSNVRGTAADFSYLYAADDPTRHSDPNGLAPYSYTGPTSWLNFGAGVVISFGAGVMDANLGTSCQNGRQIYAHVLAIMVGASITPPLPGILGSVSFNEYDATFTTEDPPDTEGTTFYGAAVFFSPISIAVPGMGISYQSIVLGHAVSEYSWGSQTGWDISALDFYAGKSIPTQTGWRACCDKTDR